MENFTTIVVVGDESQRIGFGVKLTLPIAVGGMTDEALMGKIMEIIPDAYAAVMPDGVLYDDTKKGSRPTVNVMPLEKWLEIWDKIHDGVEKDELATTRRLVAESVTKRKNQCSLVDIE